MKQRFIFILVSLSLIMFAFQNCKISSFVGESCLQNNGGGYIGERDCSEDTLAAAPLMEIGGPVAETADTSTEDSVSEGSGVKGDSAYTSGVQRPELVLHLPLIIENSGDCDLSDYEGLSEDEMSLLFEEVTFDLEGLELKLPTNKPGFLKTLSVGRYALIVSCESEGEILLESLFDDISVGEYREGVYPLDGVEFNQVGLYQVSESLRKERESEPEEENSSQRNQ